MSGGFDSVVIDAAIRVNWVGPGPVRTPMMLHNLARRVDVETWLEQAAALHPLERMARGDGRIINIASRIEQVGRRRFAHYAAAKAGIFGFTKSLAREVCERGVLVNCIAPGPISTGIVPVVPGTRGIDFIERVPLRRTGAPEEVAPTAVFLASDAASYYVGQTLGPNGGDVML